MVNQIAIVLKRSGSVILRLALAEPMVITVIPASIMVTCSIPKNGWCAHGLPY